jgi:hypothetical protein
VSKIDEFKKKYMSSKKEEEEEKTSSSPIEEFKKKYNMTIVDEADVLGSYDPTKPTSKVGQVISSNFDRMGTSEGIDGYKKYLEDEEAKKNAPKYDLNKDGTDSWWEKALGYLGGGGGVVDTTLPTAGVTQTVNDLRADESYKRPNDKWSVKERSEFGKLYLDNPNSAFSYAERINAAINKREEEKQVDEIQRNATESFGSGVDNTVGAIATAPLGLADYLQDLAYASAGRDIAPDGNVSPFEYSQAVTGGISEHLNEKGGTLPDDWAIIGGKGWGDVYGLGTSIAQSMASAYTLGGAGTLISYFGQGAAAGVDDALSRGATDEQALLYGTALGVAEGLAEKVGVDNLFKLGSSSTVKGFIKNILKQAGVEGAEEGLTSILTNIADNAIMQDKSNFNVLVSQYMTQGLSEDEAKKKAWLDSWGGVAFDTIAGAASGSVSGGLHTGVNTALTNANAKKNYSDQVEDLLVEAGTTEGTGKAVDKYINKYGKKGELSGWNISHLLEITDNQKVRSAIESRLTELGETGDIGKISDVLTKQANGIELSASDKRVLSASSKGYLVATEMDRDNIEGGNLANKWAKDIGTRRLNADVYNKSLSDYVAEAMEEVDKASSDLKEMDSVTVNTSAKENATEAKIEAPKETKVTITKDGEKVEVKPQKIASLEGGEMSLELEGGEVVNASEVDFGEGGVGLVYQAAQDMSSRVGGFNVDTANVFVRGYNAESGLSAAEYVHGFSDAYRFGKMGVPVSELASGVHTSKLSEEVRNTAYNFGRAFGNEEIAKRSAKIVSTETINANKDSQNASKKGKVHFDGSVVGKSLTERQKASLKGLGVVAEAMGVDIHIFESSVDKDGVRQGANGWYDPSDNSIHIDLHAGVKGDGLMLFTASHELTHYIREVAPGKFKIFADALLEEYVKNGQSVEELIQKKLEILEANGRLKDKTEAEAYDLAYEEVVADACESMLVDSNAIEALSKKLHEKDKGLWERIRDFIAKLVNRIRAAYKGVDPDSREGKLVREMQTSAERLQKLWVDALLEASEVSTEQTLGESGIIVNSETNSASLMSVRDVLSDADRKKVSKVLAERFGVTQAEANEWLKAETSLASLILNPKYSQYLDYTADANEEAIKSNSDYPQGTVDFSNICKKRRDFTEVMNRVLRNFPNHVFAATDLAKIRTIMEEEGMEVACAICYVEDRRQLDGPVAQDFIDSLATYREGGKIRPDGKPFNANQLKAFKLIEGDSYTPSIYELISLKGRNSLKAKNPKMEEAWVKFNNARGMQSVRLLLNDAEYKRQILKYSPSVVKRKNDLGGLRIYSFSDMEMFHLIDIIQVITDSATVGLSLQGYTKVNEYARAVKDTGEKLNRSLIPKGDLGYHMEGGRVVLDFDTVEGIDINHPDFFDNIDNPNIGNIVIGINATQIKAAMTSKFIDQIIPFHTGQSGEVLGEKGIATWDNYKDFQSERDAKTKKKSAHQINIYTEVINAAEAEGHPITNKVEFVNKFLEVCKENNLIPRFSDFLDVNENGEYIYTDGYHKFLVDFKTFDQNTGEYLPQMPVKPIFDNEYITKLLTDYVKSQKVKDAEVAKSMPKVLDRITKEIVKSSDNVKYSDRDSLGNDLTKEQQEFFKDSKARDEDGNLYVLYHGTSTKNRITQFLTTEAWRTGLWLSTDHATAVHFARATEYVENDPSDDTNLFTKENSSEGTGRQGVYELYANVKNPLIVDAQGKRYWEIPRPSVMGDGGPVSGEEINAFALENNYDGVIIENVVEGSNRLGTDVIVFSPNQVKYTDNLNPTEGNDIRYSDRGKPSYAPTFYSHMGKVIDDIKLEKMGTSSILNHLKNRGVKDEEIKWSGIETFLEGKKSVTKAELQEFVAGSQLQIVEEKSERQYYIEADGQTYRAYFANGELIDTYTYDESEGGYIAEGTGEAYNGEEDIEDDLRDSYGYAGQPRWEQYKLDGGTNYRELVFKMPNSTYSNRAMRGHWGQDAEGVLVHARMQDFNVDGKKMLFIEELQSDWHNEGREKGYSTPEYEDAVAVYNKLADEYGKVRQAFNKYVRSSEFRSDPDEVSKKKFDWLRNKMDTAEKRMQDAERDVEALKKKGMGDVADAPFRDNYHEYVLKRLLRMAAEEGYDSIGWTIADTQSKRWSYDYEKAYQIEYDQEIPKFLRKYGKKWGATVGKTYLNADENAALIETQEEYIEGWGNELAETSNAQTRDRLQERINRSLKKIEELRGEKVWSMDISDSMKDSVLYEGQVFYSDRVTDKKTLDFLEDQKHVTVYRAMQVIDGELYPPMAARVKSDDGKKSLVTPSKIGAWEQAVERPDLIRNGNKFELDKANGSSIQAAYNPYFHTSASPLNDQFSSAYKRPNLVIVEGEIPESELTSGYRAEFAKDTVGETKWHSGPVASKLKGDKARRVFLSRWFKPVRIVPDSEVASIVAKTLKGENIDIPYNVVTPSLRTELERVGVPIKYQDRNPDSYSNRSLLANALETAVQNDIEREKLRQYKQKIDLINSEEQKLHDLREQIKELSFKKGPRDTQAIRNLQFEANQAANRINTYDKQLLNLESTKALKGVLEREKALARKRDAQKYKESLERYREKASKTQRELMERYQESRKRGVESRNKTAMRHKIKDVVNDLNNYLLKGTKEKHVPIELQKAVAEALDAVNMDTVGAEERIAKLKAEMMRAKTPEAMQDLAKKIDHIEEMGGNMEAKISRLKTAYDSIINSEDPLVANSHDDVISNTIERVMEVVGNTPLRDMSLYQLEAVYDMYRMVLHSVTTANKAFKAKKSEEISVIANRVMEEVDKLGKKKVLHSKTGEAWSKFDWNNEKPVYAFERIGSETFTEVFNNVRSGEDTWATDMSEAQEFRKEQYEKHKYDSWDFEKRYEFTSSTGKKFELSLDQIMSLYAYSKRGDQAKDHLKNGGFVFDGLTEVKEKTKLGITKTYQLKDATAYNLSDETLADIIAKLTPEQKAFADTMQEYLSTVMGEKGNEVSLELYGVKLFKEKNYFPLKSAPQYLERAREQAQGDVKIKNKGFTKETVPKAKNPIVLTSFMDVWAGHVNEMSMYHSFTLALEDFYRVFNYKTPASETMDSEGVIPFIENAHGNAAVAYIDQLLKDLNGGARSDPRETVGKALMSRFKKSAVMGSLSVVVQQPTSIIRAMALVDAKYFGIAPITRGVVRAFDRKRHKALWAEVKKYAPVAIIKEMGNFDTGMGQSSVEWLKGEKSFMDKVDDVLSKAPAVADELAWISIWNAVKKETAHNNPTLKTSSEEFLRLSGERFTEVITKTQVYDSTLAKSSNMRSKSALMNMWTSFMAEPTTTINMVADAFRKGNKKYIARVLGATVGSIALNAALVSLVYAMRDDDEDETFAEKYLSRVTTEFVDGINPVTYIPFVKDMWSILQGFDVERADMALITDLFDSIQGVVKVIGKDTSDMDEDELSKYQGEVAEALWGIVDSASSLGGIPEKNIRRDINGIINLFKTLGRDMDTTYGSLMDKIGEDLKDSIPVWGWLPDEKKGDKLYDAIIKGDKAYEERLKNGYKSDSAYDSAIRKALRENDPRIKEAAEAKVNGDSAEANRIAEEIAREGHFSRENIKAAIKSEVNNLMPDDTSDETSTEDKDEAISFYDPSDINAAFENGETAHAKEIIADLIKTKVANGKTEKEAKSSLRSSMTSYWKPLYKNASESERIRIRKILYNSGLYGNADEVIKSVNAWLKD